jgi:hypothetical protein
MVDVHMNFFEMKERVEASPRALFARNTNAARLVDDLMKRAGWRAPELGGLKIDDAESAGEAIAASYFRNIDLVEALARSYKFGYAFFWQPMVLTEEKPLSEWERRARDTMTPFPQLERIFRATYRRVRQTDRPQLFYLGDIFKGEPRTVYIDWVHLDGRANRVVAERMYEVLRHRI